MSNGREPLRDMLFPLEIVRVLPETVAVTALAEARAVLSPVIPVREQPVFVPPPVPL